MDAQIDGQYYQVPTGATPGGTITLNGLTRIWEIFDLITKLSLHV